VRILSASWSDCPGVIVSSVIGVLNQTLAATGDMHSVVQWESKLDALTKRKLSANVSPPHTGANANKRADLVFQHVVSPDR